MAKIKTSPKLKSQVPTGALKDKWDQQVQSQTGQQIKS